MPLVFGKLTVVQAILEALVKIHPHPSKEEQSDGTFIFKERDDGANTRDLFRANIVGNPGIEKIEISITSNKMPLTDLQSVANQLFEIIGDCNIILP